MTSRNGALAEPWERRVPEDVWLRIFSKVLQEEEDEFRNQSRRGSPPRTVLRLACICRYWRFIVNDEPKLWRYIPILQGNGVSWNEWSLARSRSRTLTPHMYVWTESTDGPEQGSRSHSPSKFLNYIDAISTPCETLETFASIYAEMEEDFGPRPIRANTLRIIGVNDMSPLFSVPSGYLTSITHLHCDGTYIKLRDLGADDLPNVKYLTLQHTFYNMSDLMVHLGQFVGLKRLELQRVTICHDIHREINVAWSEDSIYRIEHTSLEVMRCSPDNYAALRRSVILPNVTELELTLHRSFQIHSWRELEKFDDSRERTYTLILITTPAMISSPPEEALELVRYFPNVQNLTLDGVLTAGLLRCALADETILPQLTHITVRNSHVDEETLVSFLTTHISRHSPWIHLTVENCSRIYQSTVVRLQSIVQVSVM